MCSPLLLREVPGLDKPLLRYFVLCKETRPNPEGGVDFIGLYNGYINDSFPYTETIRGAFGLYCLEPDLEHKLSVSVFLNDEIIGTFKWHPFRVRNKFEYANFEISSDLEISNPGTIKFQFHLDGGHLSTHYCEVIEGSPENAIDVEK